MNLENVDAVSRLWDKFTDAARQITIRKTFDFGVFDEQDVVSESFLRFVELKRTERYRDRDPYIPKLVKFVFQSMHKKQLKCRPSALDEKSINGETFGLAKVPVTKYEDLLTRLTESEQELYLFFTAQGSRDYDAAVHKFGVTRETLINRWSAVISKARRMLSEWAAPHIKAVQSDPYSDRYLDLIDIGKTIHEKADFRLGLMDIWVSENVRRYFEDESPCPILLSKIDTQRPLIITSDVARCTRSFQFLGNLDSALRSGRDRDVRLILEQMPTMLQGMEPVVLAPH